MQSRKPRSSIWILTAGLAAIAGCRQDSTGSNADRADLQAAIGAAAEPAASAVPVDMSKGWCGGHGVPESICTRCDDSLIPKFKETGDWCAEHGLPESQCTLCNPDVAERLAALRPKDVPDRLGGASGLAVEPNARRLLTGENDSLCQVDLLRVRFRDSSIVEKAGIQTAAAALRRISATVEAPAEVEFDATRVTRITPRAAGVVQSAAANIGDEIASGDVLAVIDSPMLGETKSRFIQRREDHALAKADSERVQIIHEGTIRLLESCSADATVEQVRNRLEGVPVGEAKSRLLRAHAALLLARATADREARLLEKSISSQQDYEIARSGLAAVEADFFAAREEIAFEAKRQRLVAERGLQVARSALDAAARKLHLLGLSKEQVAALGTEFDEALSRYELRSPVRGRIVERNVAPGEAVEETDTLFVVVDTSVCWLMIDAYELDLPVLRTGLPVLFTVDGLPGRSFEGRVSWISSQVDDRTRTVRVRADLPNRDGLLRAKMFGHSRIVMHEDAQVLTVPERAVQTDGCCQLVFVRQSDVEFEPRKVALGTSANGYVEILNGLSEGELIVTTGSFLMKTEILKSNIGAGCCEVNPGR